MAEGEYPSSAARRCNEDPVERVLEELKEFHSRSGLERTLAIGELLLTRFFDGNPVVWKSRCRKKNNSIRRLAARKDCPLRRSALNDAVAVFVAVSITPGVRTYGHVGASHVAAVASLRAEQREELLRAAETQRWTVRRLKEEILSVRRQQGDRRGRPRSPGDSKLLTAVSSAVTRVERAVGLLGASVEGGDVSVGVGEQSQALAHRLEVCAARLGGWRAPVHTASRIATGDALLVPRLQPV